MPDLKYPYSNTQVQFPPEVAEPFLTKGKKIVKQSDLYSSDKGYENNPHVTVLYGLHDQEPSMKLLDLIETHPKFTVRLGKISLFKEEKNPFDVVKADIDCNDLHILNNEIKKICAYTSDFPEYIPHATIAYVKKDTCDHLEGMKPFEGMSFVVTNILFSAKEKGTKRLIPLGIR